MCNRAFLIASPPPACHASRGTARACGDGQGTHGKPPARCQQVLHRIDSTVGVRDEGILPLEVGGERVRVAVAREPATEVLEDLEASYGLPVELVEVSQDELLDGIRRTFSASESVLELVKDLGTELGPISDTGNDQLADARDLANQPPVIRFVNLLIREAHDARASDIHLESTREGLSARFRVDGVLTELPTPPKGLQAAVVSRIKLLAAETPAVRQLGGVQTGRADGHAPFARI